MTSSQDIQREIARLARGECPDEPDEPSKPDPLTPEEREALRPKAFNSLTSAQIDIVCERFREGMTAAALAKDFQVPANLIRRYLRERNVTRGRGRTKRKPGAAAANLGECLSEGRQLSHRENLAWAVDAAGECLRTGRQPTKAPNNAAFFLYRQAVESPKEFLTKLNQLEVKRTERDASLKRACRMAIEEIDEMLASLGKEPIKLDENTA